MTNPAPVFMGRFASMKAADIVDEYLDISAEIGTATISSVTFVVTNESGATVGSVVGSHSEASGRTDFRITAPAAGGYTLTAVFTLSDGQKFTRQAGLWVV